MKLYKYEVRGSGTFPLDMLRYDCAWPRTDDDVSKIGEHPHVIRTIKLNSIQDPDCWSME